MRSNWAWPLLLIICFQWMGGSIRFKLVHSVAVVSQMDEEEIFVASTVKAETGIDAHIRVISEDSIDLKTFGYSSTFLFSKEIDGKTFYYLVDSEPVEIIHYEYPLGVEQGSGHKKNEDAALLDRFFPSFIVEGIHDFNLEKQVSFPAKNYGTDILNDLCNSSIPTPPPDIS